MIHPAFYPARRRKLRGRAILIPIGTLIVLLIGWEWIVDLTPLPHYVVPAPSEVLIALIRTHETLLTRHIPQTLLETLLGLGIAIAFGISVAALLDFVPLLKQAIFPLLVISQTIPIFALATVLILAFGFAILPKIIVVVLFCFFPITVATIDGLASTDPMHITVLRAVGASRWQIWRKTRFPSALPSFFSGLRIAATYSVGGAIAGEYITSEYGLGQYLRSAFSQGLTAQAYVAIVITVLLSISLVAIVNAVEQRVIPWYFAEARESQWIEPESQ